MSTKARLPMTFEEVWVVFCLVLRVLCVDVVCFCVRACAPAYVCVCVCVYVCVCVPAHDYTRTNQCFFIRTLTNMFCEGNCKGDE
jgi:hypothetical protein